MKRFDEGAKVIRTGHNCVVKELEGRLLVHFGMFQGKCQILFAVRVVVLPEFVSCFGSFVGDVNVSI